MLFLVLFIVITLVYIYIYIYSEYRKFDTETGLLIGLLAVMTEVVRVHVIKVHYRCCRY